MNHRHAEVLFQRFNDIEDAQFAALEINPVRVAMALATSVGGLYAEDTYRPLGLKKGSIDRALAGLEGRAEVVSSAAGPQLTDPLLEAWLHERGRL